MEQPSSCSRSKGKVKMDPAVCVCLPNANTIILSLLVGRQTFERWKQSLMSYPGSGVEFYKKCRKWQPGL